MRHKLGIGLLVGFVIGALLGAILVGYLTPKHAPSNPDIVEGENKGEILTFNVSGYPTPNLIFQQSNRLPVVMLVGIGGNAPTVSLLDGKNLTYADFVNDFYSNASEPYAKSTFTVTYEEGQGNDQGFITSITEISN